MVSVLGKNLEEARSVPGSAFGKETIHVLEDAYGKARMEISYLQGRLDQAQKNGARHVIVIEDDEDGADAGKGGEGSKRKEAPAGMSSLLFTLLFTYCVAE